MDATTATTIQAIAAAVSAVSTLVLVGVTGYYAWLTRSTVEEMRKGREAMSRTVDEMVAARELAPLPTLVCHLTIDVECARRGENFRGDATLAVAANYSALVLTNVGNAPALDVVARVGADPPDRGRLRVRPLEQRVGIVGLATDWRHPLTFTHYLIPELLAAADLHAPLDPLVVVHASSANAYGRRFATRATVELVLGPNGLTWEQRESVVELLPDENGSPEETP